ncbi:CATG protein, partial [Pardalotus punctatus]|nr:CATG protein [Pardalotus punctatus]
AAYVILTFPFSLPERIIGGREVKPHSRPYMAYLKIKSGSQSHTCGGFLIRQDAVLSAAHCCSWNMLVFPGRTMKITVILGAHNISVQEPSQQKFHVGHWVKHPNYSHDGFKNDIVLLKLKPKARITKYVKSISWPGKNERLRAGAQCKVSGWGLTSVRGHRSNVMREVELKVQNAAKCQRQFPKYQPQSMICVGDEDDEKASYRGDSGGPLVCGQKAHGIVSHGPQYTLLPVVFTRVSCFDHWIREQLRRFALQDLPGSPS